jgi:hypothetical protein
MTAEDWAKTVTFINSLGALDKPAQVSPDNYTNTYLS